MKTYKNKGLAVLAAKRALPEGGWEVVQQADGHWYWVDDTEAAALAAAKDAYAEAEAEVAVSAPAEAAEPDPFDPADPFYKPGGGLEAEIAATNAAENWKAADMACYGPLPAEEPTAPLVGKAKAPPGTFKAKLAEAVAAEAPPAAPEPALVSPEVEALVLAQGKAAGAAKAKAKAPARKPAAYAWASAKLGRLPKVPAVPESNKHALRHFKALRALAVDGDAEGLQGYPIGGTNTYSRMMRSYRDALLLALGAKAAKEAA